MIVGNGFLDCYIVENKILYMGDQCSSKRTFPLGIIVAKVVGNFVRSFSRYPASLLFLGLTPLPLRRRDNECTVVKVRILIRFYSSKLSVRVANQRTIAIPRGTGFGATGS